MKERSKHIVPINSASSLCMKKSAIVPDFFFIFRRSEVACFISTNCEKEIEKIRHAVNWENVIIAAFV